jgi:hypothetical protein
VFFNNSPTEVIKGIIAHYFNKKFWEELITRFSRHYTDTIENDASNNYSIDACVFVVAVTFLPNRCLATIGDTHTDTKANGRDL